MSPVAKESIKAASVVSLLVGLATLGLTLIMVGQWAERKADHSEVQANTERIVSLEAELEQSQRERAALLQAINRVDDKVQRLLERGR